MSLYIWGSRNPFINMNDLVFLFDLASRFDDVGFIASVLWGWHGREGICWKPFELNPGSKVGKSIDWWLFVGTDHILMLGCVRFGALWSDVG